MAGDWIKLEHVTPDKPEVWQIAIALKMSPEEAMGRLLRVWIWVDQQSLNGHALSVTDVTLDSVARYTGFARAMRDAGWLSGDPGSIEFPHFDRHNGKTAKNRGLAKNRQRTLRDGRNATSVTPAQQESDKSNEKVTHPVLPEKRREEVKPLSDALPKLHRPEASLLNDEEKNEKPPPNGTAYGHLAALLRNHGITANGAMPVVMAWVDELHITDAEAIEAVAMARMRKPEPEQIHPNYLDPIMREIRHPKPKGNGEAWWTSEAATERKARELGMWPTRGGESWDQLRDRMRQRIRDGDPAKSPFDAILRGEPKPNGFHVIPSWNLDPATIRQQADLCGIDINGLSRQAAIAAVLNACEQIQAKTQPKPT